MRICCALKLASAVGLRNGDAALIHKVTYIAQRLYGLNLGYRFAWLAGGPYSRELAAELRRGCIEGSCNINHVDVIAKRIKALIMRVSRSTGLNVEKAIDLISSYLMLALDVYPRPVNVVLELTKRKPWVTRELAHAVSRELRSLIKAIPA